MVVAVGVVAEDIMVDIIITTAVVGK